MFHYTMAMKFITADGKNIVSEFPYVKSSLPISEYKVEAVTRPELGFYGSLSIGKDTDGAEYISFIHQPWLYLKPEKTYVYKIIFPKLFGDSLEHKLETNWVQDDVPYHCCMLCTSLKLDGKEYPVRIDKSIKENTVVVIELPARK